MNFIEEQEWRGMIQNIMPRTEEQFAKGMTSAYSGFDPSAYSLHIGSLVQIMILVHLQKASHKPFALVGGTTGMVGNPSGKSIYEKHPTHVEFVGFNKCYNLLSITQRN